MGNKISRMRGEKASTQTRDGCGPTAQPTPHIVAKATVRDAIVALGAGYGFLLEPVEWRVAEYLRYEHLYAVGGHDGKSYLSTVECFDPSINVWSPVASMAMKRGFCRVATV